MKTKLHASLLGLTATVSVVLLVGCGGSTSREDVSSEEYLSSSEVSQEVGLAVDAASNGGWNMDTAAEAADTGSSATAESKIAVSGYADVVSKDPVDAARRFKVSVLEIGGKIDNEWTQNDPGYLSASVTARVPADKYQEITDSLSTFGRVQSLSTNAEDYGQQYVDYSARKSALEDSITRVKALADQAETTQDLLQAEELLTQQQSELDSLVQQLDWIDRQVTMSTLTVSFVTEQVGSADAPLSWAWIINLLAESLRSLVTFLIYILPWAIIGAVIFFITRGVVRSVRNRNQRTPLEPPVLVEAEEVAVEVAPERDA